MGLDYTQLEEYDTAAVMDQHLKAQVTCITIIDTIIHHILTNYTNDAYILYDNDI
jgi:hypothetical protein